MKTKEYFDKIRETVEAWELAGKKEKFPYSQGTIKAYNMYEDCSEDCSPDIYILKDFLWENEVEDFVRAIKEAEITQFVYTNQSTALMENIHQLSKYGVSISGLCKTIEHKSWRDVELLGIIFTVN